MELQLCKIMFPKHFNQLHSKHNSNCFRIAAEHHGQQGRQLQVQAIEVTRVPREAAWPRVFCWPISAPCVAPGWNLSSGVPPALPVPQAWLTA